MSTPTDSSPPLDESHTSTLVRCSSPPHDTETAAKTLMDELLLEIISRVPARERWRCKLVCKHWLRLAKTLPQSLTGFFYTCFCPERLPVCTLHFFNVSGNVGYRGPIYFDFNFLPDHRRITLLDCRDGLLLFRVWCSQAANNFLHVVCNPATQQWVTLPDSSESAGNLNYAHLGFDPTESSHFHVFLFLEDVSGCISGVDLYSSKTRKWIRKEKRWDQDISVHDVIQEETVFLNGYLHFHAHVVHDHYLVACLAAVATDGETWTTISVPTFTGNSNRFIQLSQGRLHYACFETDEDDPDDVELAIYVLEDYDSKQWKLKHRVQTTDLFGGLVDRDNLDTPDHDFDWIAIHPECNMIFFAAGYPKQYMCYNLDLHKAKLMRPLTQGQPPYLPYAPLYTELQSLRM